MATAAIALPGPVDAVTWVPTTPARRRTRGFDHGELLARAIGRRARLPVRRTLGRAPGPPQTELAAAARRTGPALFVLARRVPARVLLVDDVATTGATVAAAARALRGAGSETITVVTAARTPRGSRTGAVREAP
jgi:predicted amidophosphoribosyltransferase